MKRDENDKTWLSRHQPSGTRLKGSTELSELVLIIILILGMVAIMYAADQTGTKLPSHQEQQGRHDASGN